MLLGALIDLGLSLPALEDGLSLLGVPGWSLSAMQDTRCEVRGTKLEVKLDDGRRRSPLELSTLVTESRLPEPVKGQVSQILESLWRAEGRVHGQGTEALELEELGTLDTLVDVVGFVHGLYLLNVSRTYASPLVLGSATPPRWPGGYSNPAPATLELVAAKNAPVAAELALHQGAGELTTPTGAAIITSLSTFERPPMTVEGIGVGLGGKDPEGFPNVVRIWLGETAESAQVSSTIAQKQQGIVLLETNIDDATGEVLGYVQERLFALGALDVWHTPIQMKKNRPGVLLSALLPDRLESAAVELILRESPTLGVRSRPVERYAVRRDVVSIETEWGPVQVKLKYLGDRVVAAAPEYEDCRRIALGTGRPLREIYGLAEARARYLTDPLDASANQ